MPLPESPEEIPHRFAEAWNTRNATALARLFAEDADFVNVVGLWWQNREDIERAHAYGLRNFFRESTITARRIKVRRIDEFVAIVHVRWRLTGQIDKQGNTLADRFAIMVFVTQQTEEGWIVMAAHNTDIVPGSETYAAKDGAITAIDYRES